MLDISAFFFSKHFVLFWLVSPCSEHVCSFGGVLLLAGHTWWGGGGVLPARFPLWSCQSIDYLPISWVRKTSNLINGPLIWSQNYLNNSESYPVTKWIRSFLAFSGKSQGPLVEILVVILHGGRRCTLLPLYYSVLLCVPPVLPFIVNGNGFQTSDIMGQ